MSRRRAGLLLIAALHLTACAEPVAPDPLTAEEQAAAGTYTLTLANGRTPPATIGTFMSGGAGATVIVTGATLVLDSDAKTRSTSRLNVTVDYVESDPINGVVRRKDSRETVAPWSLTASTFSFEVGNPTFVMTAGTLSGGTATVVTSGAGLFGAGSPTVVLTLTKD